MKPLRFKLLWGHKDGGPESEVRCWGIEIKALFSILLLEFTPNTREAYHSHAFNSVSWLLRGGLVEDRVEPTRTTHVYIAGLSPIVIKRADMHKVWGVFPKNWVLSLRGPWKDTWQDGQPGDSKTLTHGRRAI